MTRVMALALTALTGFSGLVYEVAWEKYLATLLGSQSEATSAVLGIFLGGLSVGYSLFGRMTRRFVAAGRGARLLVLYGVVEGSIGVYVLLFPTLFQGMLSVSALLPQGVMGISFFLDLMLAAILIGPPAVLMGGTIPILTQALATSPEDATRFHALVYALNTAGAFAGALAAGFLLIPNLGLPKVMMAMGMINLTAGISFGLLGLRRDATVMPEAGGEPEVTPGFRSYAAAALLVGFAMMSLQTVFIRVGGLSLGASQFTFSMVVATFVLCIALGSLLVSFAGRIPRSALAINQWLLVGVLLVLYLLIPYVPYSSHVLRTLFRDIDQAFYAYYFAVFLSILILIGPAVILSGATLPLLFDHLRRQVADLGSVAGRLYSWNTLGSLLGALGGGYALLFFMDLYQVFHLALAALIGAAVLLSQRLGGRTALASRVLAVVALLALVVMPDWDPRPFVYGPFRTRTPTETSYQGRDAYLASRQKIAELVFYKDDPVSSVSVTEQKLLGGGLSRSIVNNGKSDGNTFSDYPTMSLLALLPAMLAERAERAFVIGFGTGVTVGELMLLPTMEQVMVSEISPAVVEAAPLFDFANRGVTKSQKVEIVRTDAYRALLGSDDAYDVIVSEPSNPWVQGVEMLFSKEFLTAARDRLRPGGVYAQWYHQYETDAESVELVLRTYAAVFDRISVWYGLGPDLIILGFQEPARPLDFERLKERAASPVFKPGLERATIRSFTELLGHELVPFGVVHEANLQGRVHTLYEPILGYMAARAFYRGEGAFLPFTGFGGSAALGRKNSMLARQIPNASAQELFRTMCRQRQRECVALLARWTAARPGAPMNRKFIQRAARQTHTFGGAIDESLVRAVSRLYGPLGDPPSTEPVALGSAERATAQYVGYYTHAIPFLPQALIDIWERCHGKDDEEQARCADGLVRARRLLRHGLNPPPAM